MNQDTATAPEAKKPILIIDTNAFIRCLDLNNLAKKYEVFTTSNVLNEIRDKKARERFALLTFDLKTGSVDNKSFSFVESFAKKTGDYASLSFTDLELISLGVYFARQNGHAEQLRKEPPELTEWIPPVRDEEDEEDEEDNQDAKAVDDDGFVVVTKGPKPEKAQKTEPVIEKVPEPVVEKKVETEVQEAKEITSEEKNGHQVEGEKVDSNAVLQKVEDNANGLQAGEESDEDDGKGWINPDNISKKLYNAGKKDDRVKELGVAIMTTDYAMQNVIIQIGIPLLSCDGYVIRQTRRFMLECYACHKMCKDTTKQFCPSCGNPSLTKLSVRVNQDGTMTYFRNPNKKVNTRGKIYSIPKTELGRKSNIILREDELLMGGKIQQLQRQEKEKEYKFKQRWKDYENGVTFDDISLKYKYQKNTIEVGYGKINPNDRYQYKKKF